MYLQDYFWFLGAVLLCAVFSMMASSKVHGAYKKYGKIANRSGMTGFDTARRLMQENGIRDIAIGRVGGTLSDHYHPAKAIVNLSEGVYDTSSVASVAIAAHELGHVMQKKEGYFFYRVRTAIVPFVNVGSFLAMPLVLLGLVIDGLMLTVNEELGFYIALVGVVLYGGSLLFSLVTLPVELDASRRAKAMLLSAGVLREDEMPGAEKVLSAAALTYLASLLTSLVYFWRFLVYVLTIFGRRDNRR